MLETLTDADQVFIAQWGREVIKVVLLVGALIGSIYWLPSLTTKGLGSLSEPTTLIAAVVTFICLMKYGECHLKFRNAERLLERLKKRQGDDD